MSLLVFLIVYFYVAALSDVLKGRLFKALIESVLLYNEESWTTTEALVKQVDLEQAPTAGCFQLFFACTSRMSLPTKSFSDAPTCLYQASL